MPKMKRVFCNSRMLSIALASLCFFASNAAAEPRDSEVSRADQLANAIFFEGVPFEEASDLSDAGIRLDGDYVRGHNVRCLDVCSGMSRGMLKM